MNIVMPAAGLGTRMHSGVPKHLIPIHGIPMFHHALMTFHPDIYALGDVHVIVREEHVSATQELLPDARIQVHGIPSLTTGPAMTLMMLRHIIDNEDALLTLNCDQIFHWDGQHRIHAMMSWDAGVFVTPSTSPSCSYVQMDDAGCAMQFAEKKVISPWALTGVHYWKHGCDFVASCRAMVDAKELVNNEHYISMTYNYLLHRRCIHPIIIPEHETILVGTHQELQRYASQTINGIS